MARRRQVTAKSTPILPRSVSDFLARFAWRCWGVVLVLGGIALVLALTGYDPADPNFNVSTTRAVTNPLGATGAHAADLMLQTLGLASAALILPLFTWGWRIIALRGLPRINLHVLLLPVSVIFLSLFASSIGSVSEAWPLAADYGGATGQILFAKLLETAAIFDLIIPALAWQGVFGVAAILFLVMTLGIEREDWRATGLAIGRGLKGVGGLVAGLRHLTMPAPAPRQARKKPASAKPAAKKKARVERREPVFEDEITAPAKTRVAKKSKTQQGTRAASERQARLNLGDDTGFELPALELLTEPEADHGKTVNESGLEQNARILEGVLDDFGIKGDVGTVRPGPVVTLYELEPAPGIKSSRVIGLADDIARSMSAISARVAVVPGRNAIGIELPNSKRETVYLRELLASRDFEKSKASLPLALGKDIGGEAVVADLAAMPHLLVAGTTGSGKSVAINAMILSLLYRLSPSQCRFIMVDPKMLELSVYDGIPHLLTPVVTEPRKAVVALKWAVREMEERYRAMSKLSVRNLAAYNERVEHARKKGETLKRKVQTGFDEGGQPVFEEQEFDFEPFPQIVIVIDEMADLMLVAGKDVEAMVQRLAQMARAAGIHMIMATQRPSVDVITGTIKANFPIRISFQVTSKIDSRTILGEQGAEQLLGKGDMLYMTGGGRVTRVHGPFVTDEEVEGIVAHLKRQGTPSYLQDITEEPEGGYDSPFIPGGDSGGSATGNELYDKAVDIVLRDRKASTSYVQRRLKIGYNRAASLIEQMEDNGVISGPNHAGKREILVPGPDETI